MNSKTLLTLVLSVLSVSIIVSFYLQSQVGSLPDNSFLSSNDDVPTSVSLFAARHRNSGSEPKPVKAKNDASQKNEPKHKHDQADEKKLSNKVEPAQNQQELQKSGSPKVSTNLVDSLRTLKVNPYKELGVYKTMPKKYYNMSPNSKLYKVTRYYGIKKNSQYCEQVDLYNLAHPENIFKNINFVSDYAGAEKLVRKYVMPRIGKDVLPEVRMTMPVSKYGKSLYTLPTNATMYFFKRVNVHHYYEINKQMICKSSLVLISNMQGLSQMYNHIPGHGVLTRKDLVMDSVKDYMKKYEKKPQCIEENVYFPAAYRLNNAEECHQFFDEINSDEFKERRETEPIPFIIKVGFGAHRARGLALFDAKEEMSLKEKYANGIMCGKLKQSLVAQKYISNPLVLDKNNKFDFRIYMLVASVNPLIVYYHDGFLRVSLSTYDKFSTQTNVHFTNTHLSKKIFAKARKNKEYKGMTEKELRDYQMWSMEELQEYLLETGKINNPNWLAEELRPKFQQAYVHLIRMAEESFYKSSSVFELYGLDFVIDENLDIWFIECNASPQLVGTNSRKKKFLGTMLMDMFEIQNALLKSRMKRVFQFVKEMQNTINNGTDVDYQVLEKEFNRININKLEPEFSIRPKNGFTLIMDRNLKGADAYFGHISKECVSFD